MRYLILSAFVVGLLLLLSWLLVLTVNVKTNENPDILIVESWLPSPYLEETANYILENKIDSVWIVGMEKRDTSVWTWGRQDISLPTQLITNGYLRVNYNSPVDSDTIRVDVEGSEAFGAGCFLLAYVNDQFICSEIISGRDTLQIPFSGEVDDLTLVFGNDARCVGHTDRNLRILSISNLTDKATIEKRYGRVNAFPIHINLSGGQVTKSYLQKLGCTPEHFLLVEGTPVGHNKTLQAALLFRTWLSQNYRGGKKPRINIFTTPEHSRRTYINYKNALKDLADVGVHKFGDDVDACGDITWVTTFLAWGDETASTIYTYFYWLVH